MAIDVQAGQFCVIQSRYGGFRIVRADKVTPKQIKSHIYGSRYNTESRDLVIFAGEEADARRLGAEADKLRIETQREISAAVRRRDEACAPFIEQFTTEKSAAQGRLRDALLTLFRMTTTHSLER